MRQLCKNYQVDSQMMGIIENLALHEKNHKYLNCLIILKYRLTDGENWGKIRILEHEA